MSRLALVVLVLVALVFAGCGSDDGGSSGSTSTPAAADTSAQKSKLACAEVPAPEPREGGDQTKPTEKLAPDKTYDVVMTTSCGEFTIRLDQKTAPNTAASFASLVKAGFYDDTVFHRIVPDFVIQGGDPTATGTGGPGYSVRDTPPADTRYTRGVAAMAKAGDEPPGAAGSQFFVVTGPDAGLPPDYGVLGKVVKGLPVVELIGRQPPREGGADGAVVIQKATLAES